MLIHEHVSMNLSRSCKIQTPNCIWFSGVHWVGLGICICYGHSSYDEHGYVGYAMEGVSFLPWVIQ